MLYAHYEGFCKFCWTCLLNAIQADSCRRSELIDPLAKRSMDSVFKRLRGNTSDERLWRFAFSEFHLQLMEPATFPEEVDTQSNLWPNLSQKINETVGLRCPLLSQHHTCHRTTRWSSKRHRAWKKLEIADLKQLQMLENAAVLVMHELAIAVSDAVASKAHLRPPRRSCHSFVI